MKKLLLLPILLFVFSCTTQDLKTNKSTTYDRYFYGIVSQNENGFTGHFNIKINSDNTFQQNQSIMTILNSDLEISGTCISDNTVSGILWKVYSSSYEPTGTFTGAITNGVLKINWNDTQRHWTGTMTSTE